ncbi:helix-turn-helix domain-containing protein [Pseudonocardia alaniniphila]|uniref:Helix-turn-helix domain-containing protein n=1 Tax=Pseudonocardia alaniniphila TaxID=75291 RepID=A0ABS9TTB2_9PSEU|nr:helix-turn-helix domain-containing protein [Pseudonocardia alaniniphila]MCH6171769.1 helix-turn-helix domain-containing protein [Pseudonocardia alaniniphila]
MQIHEFASGEFEDVAGEFFIPVIVRTAPGVRGRMAVQDLGEGLVLSRLHSGPRSADRTDRMAATASEDDRMLFVVQVAGQGRFSQHNRLAELGAGMGFLHEARAPFTWVSQTDTRHLVLSFSRELLALRAPEITEACGRSMDPASPAMHTLAAYLDRLFEIADGLTLPQRLDAGHAAIDLLAMALRDVVPSVAGGDGPAEVLLDMMLMHVREHLADPHLQVDELARRHHVSVSHVYTLFERIGSTPASYLREQRLLAAQAMLADPRHARLATSDIAAVAGFVDRRTFERAFRRQYGMTPGNWRRERCRSGSASATLEEEMPPP